MFGNGQKQKIRVFAENRGFFNLKKIYESFQSLEKMISVPIVWNCNKPGYLLQSFSVYGGRRQMEKLSIYFFICCNRIRFHVH